MKGTEEKSEIVAISNKYKDTFDDLIDSSNTGFPDQSESPNWLKFIDKEIRNAPRSKGTSPSLLEEEKDYLDEDILVILLELAPKIWDSQMYKCHDVAPFGPKSRRA